MAAQRAAAANGQIYGQDKDGGLGSVHHFLLIRFDPGYRG
jgi:hypothetical protein